MTPLQDLDISTEGHCAKQIFNPFDFQKVLIDERNDPDINFFNDKSEAVVYPNFCIKEFLRPKNFLKIRFLTYILILSLNKSFEKLREYLSCKKGFQCCGLYRDMV